MRTLVTPTLYAKSASLMANFKPEAVPDPDLEMWGGGGGGARSSRPLDKGGGGGGLPKLFFGPSGLSLGSKNNGGDLPLDPLLLKKGFAPYRRPLGS